MRSTGRWTTETVRREASALGDGVCVCVCMGAPPSAHTSRRLIGIPHARGFARHRSPSVRAAWDCLPGMSRGRGWPTKLTTTPIRISVSVTELRLGLCFFFWRKVWIVLLMEPFGTRERRCGAADGSSSSCYIIHVRVKKFSVLVWFSRKILTTTKGKVLPSIIKKG